MYGVASPGMGFQKPTACSWSGAKWVKSILGATEIVIYSERGENADYYGEKNIVVSVKIKKLWRVKVSGSESSHFEKKQFKVVQHILGIFP